MLLVTDSDRFCEYLFEVANQYLEISIPLLKGQSSPKIGVFLSTFPPFSREFGFTFPRYDYIIQYVRKEPLNFRFQK